MIGVFKNMFGALFFAKSTKSAAKPGQNLMTNTLSEIKEMYRGVVRFRIGANETLGPHLTSVKYNNDKEVLTKATVVPRLFSKMLNSEDVSMFLNDCDNEERQIYYDKIIEGFCDTVSVIDLGLDRCYCAQLLIKDVLDSELFCKAYLECRWGDKKDVVHNMNSLIKMTHSKDAGTSFQCKEYSSQQLFNSMLICLMLGDSGPKMVVELLRNVFFGYSVDDAIRKLSKEVSIIGMLPSSAELSAELKHRRISPELQTVIMHNAGRALLKADELFTDTTLDSED